MSTLRKFCIDHGLPDLSPLVASDLPTPARNAVVWKVMQTLISVEQQGEFLRSFCESSGVDPLVSFALILRMNPGICSTAMDIIPAIAGFDWDKMGASLKNFCETASMKTYFAEKNITGVVTLTDKCGLESIVYSIDKVFPLVDHPMRYALDQLKFEVNPVRFEADLDKAIKRRDVAFAAEMGALTAKLEELTAMQAELIEQMGGSHIPGIGEKRAR